jgi:hypothetical protein
VIPIRQQSPFAQFGKMIQQLVYSFSNSNRFHLKRVSLEAFAFQQSKLEIIKTLSYLLER